MTFWERFKRSTSKLKELFKVCIAPLVVILFIYYLATHFLLFPFGRFIWSKALAMLPDGYIGTNNIMDLFTHPVVLIIAILLIIAYSIISFFQIEMVFIFITFNYDNKSIGFKQLLTECFKRIGKIVYPKNWAMLIFSMLIIPFVNLFQLSNDFGAIVVPEYIFTVIKDRTGLFIAYCLIFILLFYLVLKGLYIFMTFTFYDNNYREAFKMSAKLTKGASKKAKMTLGLVISRAVTIVLFSIVPILLVSLINKLYSLILTNKAAFTATRELISNRIAYPAITAFSTAMSCAVVISLIVIWFYDDLDKYAVNKPELKDYSIGKFDTWVYDKFSKKMFTIILIVATLLYCIGVPVCYSFVQNNDNFVKNFGLSTAVIAHKGYTAKAPENTLESLNLAIKTGSTDVVEFDVQTTKDGVPVVIHDRNANALHGVDREICDMTLNEVRSSCPKIPTLEEWLVECNHRILLLLEIKNYSNDPNLVPNIMEILKKYDYLDGSLMIHSGSIPALKKVKEIDPDMRCGLIMTIAIGTFYDLPFADFYSIETSFVDRNTVDTIHSRYKSLFVWTVDEKDVVESMCFAGVDGIICDDPDLVKSYINNYEGSAIDYAGRKLESIIGSALSGDVLEKVDTKYGD